MDLSSRIIETYWQALRGAATDVSFSIADDSTALYPERFVVQSLLLLQSTLGNWASASPVDVSPEFVKQFAELLVTRLLPLRQVDLEKWADDPEEYMNEEEADRWEYELRVSCDWSRSDARRKLMVSVSFHSPAQSMSYNRYLVTTRRI